MGMITQTKFGVGIGPHFMYSEDNKVLGMEPGSVVCKVRALTTMLYF